ncbi:Ig-like domain-containing protein [Bacillus sp. AFS017336]|uniref:Ig-like domain-containing protein n=1 Tax=Bacillus sp. AFS017336 TaxID=2033489 RepID=UPI000BEF5378|nr:Ig-like domain-containing protein [Bacillus sp. AFS017336]PEL05817.1 hypothetical protein CN601_21210 [Bacillus sp. AFS017336]
MKNQVLSVRKVLSASLVATLLATTSVGSSAYAASKKVYATRAVNTFESAGMPKKASDEKRIASLESSAKKEVAKLGKNYRTLKGKLTNRIKTQHNKVVAYEASEDKVEKNATNALKVFQSFEGKVTAKTTSSEVTAQYNAALKIINSLKYSDVKASYISKLNATKTKINAKIAGLQVASISKINDITVYEGNKVTLPKTVEVKLVNGQKLTKSVVWNTNGVNFSKAGIYTITGTVTDVNKKVTVKVTVSAPVKVSNPTEFVQTQDFGYWEDAGEGRAAYNVGFKLNLAKLPYIKIKEIQISLVDKNGKTIASRTATGSQILKLQSDDQTYGGLDGQLSAAFIQRDAAATNEWWTSTAYDFSTPAKTVITIKDTENKLYSVENNNPTGIPTGPVANSESFVQTQDFGYWEDAGNGRPAYNVGFKLDLAKLPYNMIKEINVALVDQDGKTLAQRTATGNQIKQLQADDVTYGGLDGQLSAAFIQRDDAASNGWWTSSSYDFTAPTKAVITIKDKDNKIYLVENNNPTGVPSGPVANSESFVQPQDFGYWNNYDGKGNSAYNVGFKLDLTKLPYTMIKEIKVMLEDENGNSIATKIATGKQILKLQADDQTYGGLDGQLSTAFIKQDAAVTGDWWTSSTYDFSVPKKVVIQITDKDQKKYVVENSNPTGVPVLE